MNIFVAKLHSDTSSDTLREVFEQYGEVESAKVIMDRETGRSRGFGFVEMSSEDEGQEAIRELNESQLDGRTIVVKQAEDRENRSAGGGNRGGSGGGFNKFGGGGGGNRNGGGGSGGGNRFDAPRRREY